LKFAKISKRGFAMRFDEIDGRIILYLSDKFGIEERALKGAVESFNERPYITYWKKKKTKGRRKIFAPCSELMAVQQGLKDFFYQWDTDPNLFGFQPGRSAKEGAKIHLLKTRAPRWMLRIDLKDAFPSIKSAHLRHLFRELLNELFEKESRFPHPDGGKLKQNFCELLVELTSYKGALIQGAPTSPYLLNLLLVRSGLISELKQICKQRGEELNFSVYADDFCITSPKRRIPVKKIIKAINKSGIFKVNMDKVKLNKIKHGAHKITGISLCRRPDFYYRPFLTVSKKYTNKLRGKLHRAAMIMRSGRLPENGKDGFSIPVLQGQIGWVKFICEDNLPASIKKVVQEFNSAYRGYQDALLME